MRQGQHSKKNRGRNRRQSSPGNRVYESNGPDVKIRGNASHVSEKYLALARDAQAAGDPIASENYLQHAEHYLRIIAASQAPQQQQAQPCAPDQVDKASDGARDEAQPRARGRSRSNGDGRRDEEVAASEEIAAEANGAKQGDGKNESDVRDGAEQVNGEDATVTQAPAEEAAADGAEETATEAS